VICTHSIEILRDVKVWYPLIVALTIKCVVMSHKDILAEPGQEESSRPDLPEKKYDIPRLVMPEAFEEKSAGGNGERPVRVYRTDWHQLSVLINGVQDLYLGADYRWLRPHDLVIIPENMLFGSQHISNCTGYRLRFRAGFIRHLVNRTLEEEYPFFAADAEHVINLMPEQSQVIQQAFRDIIREYQRFSPEKDYLLQSFIQILLLRIREYYYEHTRLVHEGRTHAQQVAAQFKRMLLQNFMEVRKVEQFAAMMEMTPKHLCDMVKEATGKTPKQIMIEVLMLEVRVLLGNTNKSMVEIARDLRFQDQAHFSHFVSQHTGLSPLRLRRRLL